MRVCNALVSSALLAPVSGLFFQDHGVRQRMTSARRGDGDGTTDGTTEEYTPPDHKPFENPEIATKYDKLETVNQALFMIACRLKHQADVRGLAKEKVKERVGKMDTDELMKEMETIQKKNVEEMKKSCGKMNSKGWKNCRKGCTDRFASSGAGSQTEAKQECIDLCEKKYSNYEQECLDQAENLKNVYDTERGTMTAGSRCADLHCPDFPNIVMESDDAKAKTMLEEQCGVRCKELEGEADCTDKCKNGCKLGALRKCGKDLTKNLDVTVDYCNQLWEWMYDSEEIDPKTGNPVV